MLEALVSTYIGGIICILAGLAMIYFVRNKKIGEDKSVFQPVLSGWAGGIAAIILGILIIGNKFFEN